jgi:hypothetical protein
MTCREWCEAHGVTHAHCPHLCEHPQPFIHDNELICGRHAVMFGVRVVMIPCIPEICGEDAPKLPGGE